MIEINSEIIDSKLLEERVRSKMKLKLIHVDSSTSAIRDMNKMLNSIRESFQRLLCSSRIRELPISSHRKLIGGGIVFIKRVFRKLTRWLFSTYYNQQNEFNETVVQTINKMIALQENMISFYKNSGSVSSKSGKVLQVVSSLNFGDAIGNDVIAIDKILREEKIPTKIYTKEIHKKLVSANVSLLEELPDLHEEDILIYHAASEDDFMNRLKDLPCKRLLWYHNITPEFFFKDYDDFAYVSCKNGLQLIKEIKDDVDYAVADSVFNKHDLLQYGYSCPITVIPILIPFFDYENDPDRKILETYNDDYTNLLFVGRMAPNKKVEDIIRQFAYYKKNVNNKSRLFLVGNYNENDKYFQSLLLIIKKESISDVIFSGHISFEAILAYYTIADVFLCMSEHEGFCVPLVEAMKFRLPVIAYNCTAIPETLNGAGVLVNDKSPENVAHTIRDLLTDVKLQEKIQIAQKENLERLSYQSVKKQIIDFIKEIQR